MGNRNRPPRRANFGALVIVPLLAACPPPFEERVVHGNAAFADEDSAVLLASSSRMTSGDSPWYYDPNATDWQVVFHEASVTLGDVTEIGRALDISQAQGGGILSAPLYWLRAQERAVAHEYHQAVVYELTTGTRRVFDLSPSERDRLFTRIEADLSEDATPSTVTPSPDGETLAVHFIAPFAGPGGIFDLRFHHAIAFFDIDDGALLGAEEITPFNGEDMQLRLSPPNPVPFYDTVEPPAHQRFNFLPASFVVTCLWAKDSSGVTFVRNTTNNAGVVVESRALFFTRDGAEMTEVDEAPTRAVPTPGGPVSSAGVFLLVDTPEGDPDGARVVRHETTEWVPFVDIEVGDPALLGHVY
jgi:hypothetical protein